MSKMNAFYFLQIFCCLLITFEKSTRNVETKCYLGTFYYLKTSRVSKLSEPSFYNEKRNSNN